MVRRSLGVALWGVVGLLAGVLGALSALIGTGAGRDLVARAAGGRLRQVFPGTVEIGDVGGTLLTGLTLSDVRLFDPDTTLVAWLPRADLSYNPLEFAAGRVVLFELDLRQPVFNIVQHPSGRLNAEALAALRGPDTAQAPRGPAPLILFRTVRIEDGSVMLRLRAGPAPDTTHEIDAAARDGPLRVRRFDHLAARLAALRLSSPRDKGIRMDITGLAVRSSDPAVELRDVAGRITVVGDSLDADLERVRLPGSALQARGRVRWPHGTLLFDLAARADSATLSDFRFIDSRFPDGAVLRGGVALRSHGSRVLEVRLDPLTFASGGGTVTGRLTALSAADSGLVALRGTDLEARDFDLEFARPFLDRLPLAGRLSGHTVAEGAIGALHLETDWVFRDSLVPGWPQSTVRGRGEVDLSRGAGVGFRSFGVDAAAIDLGTVRRLVPAGRRPGAPAAAGPPPGRLARAPVSGPVRHPGGRCADAALVAARRPELHRPQPGARSLALARGGRRSTVAAQRDAQRDGGRGQRRAARRAGHCRARAVAVRGRGPRQRGGATALRRPPRVRGFAAPVAAGTHYDRQRCARVVTAGPRGAEPGPRRGQPELGRLEIGRASCRERV